MEGIRVYLLLMLVCGLPCCLCISDACMKIYEDGGAHAVFQSPECRNWIPTRRFSPSPMPNCQFASIRGRQPTPDDHASCNLDFMIPILGTNRTGLMKVGLVAVFDGHGGAQASEMASKLLLDYFYLHTVFSVHRLSLDQSKKTSKEAAKKGYDEQLQILKDALYKTIIDIDESFTKEALENNVMAGTSSVIALLAKNQILVANLGVAKAFLCTERFESFLQKEFMHFAAEELTRAHTPGRDDERARIEKAGGSVVRVFNIVPLINGIFGISRAIGFTHMKRYGVIAEPEMTEWRYLTSNDSALVVSSGGIFGVKTPRATCKDLWLGARRSKSGISFSSSALPKLIVNSAYMMGSRDDMSVFVVPFK